MFAFTPPLLDTPCGRGAAQALFLSLRVACQTEWYFLRVFSALELVQAADVQ